MSESLRECETESVDANGDQVVRGEWKCGRCPEKVTWESRVPEKKLQQCDSPEAMQKLIEAEKRYMRRDAGRTIEKHLSTHLPSYLR